MAKSKDSRIRVLFFFSFLLEGRGDYTIMVNYTEYFIIVNAFLYYGMTTRIEPASSP